jgi:hypothetical protein
MRTPTTATRALLTQEPWAHTQRATQATLARYSRDGRLLRWDSVLLGGLVAKPVPPRSGFPKNWGGPPPQDAAPDHPTRGARGGNHHPQTLK